MSRRSYGTGSLFARTDSAGRETWYGQWRTGGRQVRRALGPKRAPGSREGLTRAQGEARMRDLMAEVRLTTGADRHAVTIARAGELYLAHLKRAGRKTATRTAVASALRVHLEPFFGEKTLGSIRHEDVVDLVGMLERRGVGPKSIRNYVGILSALFNYARAPQRRWCSANPCEGLELPAVAAHTEIRFLTLDEVDALVTNAQPGIFEDVDRALYVTAAMTGLRVGELIALRWTDVDWLASRIRVRRSYVLGEFGTPKSKRSSRSVPMADDVARALEALSKASRWTGESHLVFGHPATGEPLCKAAILRRMRKALRAAALDETHRFHDLRHTFGTRMAAAGVAMRTLQEWMGHRDLQTTQRYADYAPSSHEADLVAAAFARTSEPGASVCGLTTPR